MRIATAVFVALALPSLLLAQGADSLSVGERVRVRLSASRNYSNVFIGNIASLSPDTLVLEIPGNRGTIVLPRLAIAEIAIPNGRESRFARLPILAPLIAAPVLLATTSASSAARATGTRNRGYFMAAAMTLPVISIFTRTPAERWQPVYGWLDGRRAP